MCPLRFPQLADSVSIHFPQDERPVRCGRDQPGAVVVEGKGGDLTVVRVHLAQWTHASDLLVEELLVVLVEAQVPLFGEGPHQYVEVVSSRNHYISLWRHCQRVHLPHMSNELDYEVILLAGVIFNAIIIYDTSQKKSSAFRFNVSPVTLDVIVISSCEDHVLVGEDSSAKNGSLKSEPGKSPTGLGVIEEHVVILGSRDKSRFATNPVH